jgi:hypothetical protein
MAEVLSAHTLTFKPTEDAKSADAEFCRENRSPVEVWREDTSRSRGFPEAKEDVRAEFDPTEIVGMSRML